jgi:hypothetical protein
MKWLVWERGRQNSGYYKMLLAYCKFPAYIRKYVWGWDLYLLWYPEGSEIPEHVDTIEGYCHYRINLVLKKCLSGGEFQAQSTILSYSRLKIFRSDQPHSVTKINQGTRCLLSFGICFKDKEGVRS